MKMGGQEKDTGVVPTWVLQLCSVLKMHHWPCLLQSPLVEATCLWADAKEKYKSILFSYLHPSHFWFVRHRRCLYLWPWASDEKTLMVGWQKCWAVSSEPIWGSGTVCGCTADSIFPPSSVWHPAGNIWVSLMKPWADMTKCNGYGNGRGERGKGRGDKKMKGRRWGHLSRMLGDLTCPQSTIIILSHCDQWTEMPTVIPLHPFIPILRHLSCHLIVPCHFSSDVCGISI